MKVQLKDNEIYSIANIHDIALLRVGIFQNKIQEVKLKMFNGAWYETDSEFYQYCLQRMTELTVFIPIEVYAVVLNTAQNVSKS